MSTLDPKQPLLSNPAFGKGVAAALGTNPGVLLSGHGVVMTGRSIYNLVGTSYQLRQNARIQQQAIALRGRVASLPVPPPPQGAGNAGGGPQGGGQQLGPPEGRDWVYWAQTIPID
jgi:ribulose-5-phosphate 4-epimerase/fuculose-1-phosphate aldolase